MKAALGFVVVAAHAAMFAVLATRCHGAELSVELAAANAAQVVALDGVVPVELMDRVEIEDAEGPGLHRRRWTVRYRGGFERAVGAAQLVGPFQDPVARACVGRIVMAQRLLDDGTTGPGTIAGQLATALTAELAGEEITGAGSFEKVSGLSLRWAKLEWHPYDRGFVGEAPHGYVRVEARIEFTRVEVPVTIALIPRPATTELAFRIASRAELAFDNRVAQWISDKLGGDKLATRLARGQIDRALISTLAPPPPFTLPGGQILRFTYCADPPEILEGLSGALPFAIELGRVAGEPLVLPPKRGPAPRPFSTAPLALDLDLDALNALLYELWRTGVLDATLAQAGLDTRFNTDPIVTEFLTLRISPLRLALPPVLSVGPRGLRLVADARVTIMDRTTPTVGRVWGGLDVAIAGRGLEPIGVDLGALELTCERSPTTLVPCYADLVGAIRGRGAEFHGALTTAFAGLVQEIFVERRLGASGLPADLVIRRVMPKLTVSGTNASLHFDLDASLVPAR